MVYSEERKCPSSYGMGITEKSESSQLTWKFWKQRRYVVALLAFFGFFNTYALRVNLSIAIVAMTELKNVTLDNGTIIARRDFDWDSKLQGYLLSAFFYGYITTQLLGGYLAARIGGKRVFGSGIAVTAALTIVTPWIAHNVYLLMAVRIIEGVFEGVTYPSMHEVWAKWAPPLERTRLATLALSGSYFGTVVSMPLCSFLASTLGWQSIFYIFGTVGLIWYLLWMIIVSDKPELDSKISQQELQYITESLAGHNKKQTKIPWRSFVTSMPVWAITVSHFSENWGFYTLLTQLPKFMKNVLHFDLNKAGFMSALPYLVMGFMTQFAGQFADWFRARNILSTTQVRRVFNCGAFLSQTVFMMAAAFWLSPIGTTFCLTMAVGLGAFAWGGFGVNHLDIAPPHASILMGFSNTFATIPGIISPTLTGYLVTNESSAEEWRMVFYLTSGIYLFGALFYAVFVSGVVQPWAVETKPLEEEKPSNEQNNPKRERVSYDNKSFDPDT